MRPYGSTPRQQPRSFRYFTHVCLVVACLIALVFWALSSYRLSHHLSVHAHRSRHENPQRHHALQAARALADKLADAQVGCEQAAVKPSVHQLRFPHAGDKQYKLWSLPKEGEDLSVRCAASGICDGSSRCGPDELGCVVCAEGRRRVIQQAARESWVAYKATAWGDDELVYLKIRPARWMGLGLTIVDSLDTLLLMGLKKEYTEAREWVATRLLTDDKDIPDSFVSVFEITIRVLGGLLSAHYLSDGDPVYLQKAVQLAERLLPAFNTSNGVVKQYVNLRPPPSDPQQLAQRQTDDVDGEQREPHNLAKAGSLSMEFTTLAELTGRDEFRKVAMAWWDTQIDELGDKDGLVCTHFDASSLSCRGHLYSMGPSADSCYEYMLKQWLLSGKKHEGSLKRYKAAMRGVRKHLVVGLRPVPPQTVRARWLREHGQDTEVDVAEADAEDEEAALRSEVREELSEHQREADGQEEEGWRQTSELGASAKAAIDAATAGAAALQQEETRRRSLLEGPGEAGDQATGGGASSVTNGSVDPKLLWILADAELGFQRHSQRSTGGNTTAPGVKHKGGGGIKRALHLYLRTHHLACFLPGLLTLGHLHGVNTAHGPEEIDDLHLAVRLMRACYELSLQSPTGLAYEMVSWNPAPSPGTTQKPGDAGGTASRGRTAGARLRTGGTVIRAKGADGLRALRAVNSSTVDSITEDEESGETGRAHRRLQSMSLGQAGVSAEAARHEGHRATLGQEGGTAATSADRYELSPTDRANYLRPEVVESLFYLYRATGDNIYREWGWSLFRSFHRYSRQPDGGHTSVLDVTVSGRLEPAGRQESFWLAEVLKYLYLLFSDEDDLPLDRFIFNTEAHPFPVHGTPIPKMSLAQ